MSQLQRAANALLLERTGQTLVEFLKERRDDGVAHWRIAQDLRANTGGAIDVSPTSVWAWCEQLLTEAPSPSNGEVA